MKSSQIFRCLKSDTLDISLRSFRFSESSCHIHWTSRRARDFRSICFLFLLLFLVPLSYAQTPPETTIISGPSGIIGYEDTTFWWVGSTTTTSSRIVGYYYELDNQGRVFTEANRVTFFGMAEGAHTFRIRAVDTNDLEDETPDERSFQVSPGRQVEIEPNYVSSLANVLQPNLQVGGSSADAQDIDWYKFQIPSNIRQVAICFKRTGGIGETTAKVYRGDPSDASKIAEFTINPANTQRQCVTLGVGAGDYFINIQAKTVDTNFVSYALTVVHVSLIDEVNWDTERNDTFESANALHLPPTSPPAPPLEGRGDRGEVGAVQTLTLIGDRHFTGDIDWFKLHVSARQQLRLILDRPGAAGDTVIDLYRSPLFSGDITGRQIGRLKASALTGQHAEFQATVTLGDYFLKVDNGSESNNQPYIVSLTLAGLPEEALTEIEPNSISPFIDPTAGSLLPFSRTMTGTSWDSNADIDWFRVAVPPSTPTDQSFLSLSFSRPLGIGSTGLEVFNPNSVKIGELTVSTTNTQQGQIALPVKGGPVARDFASLNVHTIKLTPQNESSSAEYRLIAAFVQSLTHDAKEPLVLGEPLTVNLLMPQGIAAGTPSFELVGNFASETAIERTRRIPLPFLGVDAATGGRRNVGRYVPVSGDDVTDARVVVHFFDLTGGDVVISLPQPITIDTIAPKIESIAHNGVSGVRVAGERLTITLTGDMDAQAQFEIIDPITQTAKIRISPSAIRKTGSAFEVSYTITATDEVVDGIVVGRLVDAAGNATTIQAGDRVTIRAAAPKITAASHDGRVLLGRGAKLTVTMTASPGGSATFSIGIDTASAPILNRAMFDDGKHNDGGASDGVYAGTYTVAAGDDFTHAQITVRFTDARGVSAELNLPDPVTLDGTAPAPVLVTRAIDVPDDEGFALLIEWEASIAPDFSYYNVYLDGRPIRSLVGLSPALTELVTTRANLPVNENNVPFFLAVTAVDRVGNESANPSESGAGPVRALDNLPPEPVLVVTAADTPDDFGGSVTVSWTQPRSIGDFDHYNLYTTVFPNLPIVQFPGFPISRFFTRTPTVVDVPTPADNVELFFVVTAVDGSGNESTIRPESIAGPVRSVANVEIQPAGVLHFDSGPVGLIRYNDVIFRWNRLETGNYLYQLDEHPPQPITSTDTRLILRDLERGAHRFIIQTATDSVPPSTGGPQGGEKVERQFTVAESTLTENEPNDSPAPAQMNLAPVGWTVTGRLSQSDRDYYRLAIKKSLAKREPDLSGRGVVDLHYTQREGEAPAEPLDGETNLRIYRESVTPSNQVAEAKVDAANRSRSISFGAAPGNYIIFIDNQSSATEVRQSTYELSAAFSPGDLWEIEPNNDGITATPLPSTGEPPALPPGERLVRGTSWSESDTDWYRIDVSQTGLLIINFLRESLGGETTIALHDAGGRIITTRTQSSGIGTSLSAPVSRGNYFVEVTPKNVDAFSEYHLMATQIDGAEFRIDDGTSSPPLGVGLKPIPITLGDRLNISLQWMEGGTASFSLGGIQSGIPLLRLGDEGVYKATFPIPDGLQLSDVPVVIRLIGNQHNAFDFELTPRLAIDTVTSPIASIEHDATAPLVEGKTLTVTLTGSPDASVTYEIINAETGAVLIPTSRFQPNPPAPFPEGKGGLLPSPPGEGPGERSQQYTATYTIRDSDFVANGRVRGALTKLNGRTVSATATRRVQIDALPPEPVAGVQSVDRPGDEGRTLQVTWSPASAPDIAEYEIYLQRQAFSKGKIVGAAPVLRVSPSTSGRGAGGEVAMPVESNGVDYFVAIIAVDGAGNRSVIGESSSAGPVRAIDNLPPDAVTMLTAFDTPDDAGGKVTLQWTHPSGALDFDHYNIYRSEQPFTGFRIQDSRFTFHVSRFLTTIDVPTPFDDVDFYFAITAVDQSGNESAITEGSSFGPVRSLNNLIAAGESSVRITAGPSGLIRHNDVIFHWSRRGFGGNLTIPGTMTRYIYRLDEQPPQSTTDTAIAFFNLPNGAHRFYLRATDESIEIERPFTVSVTTLAESEPNNTPVDANPIEVGVTHIGTLADVDLYRLDVNGASHVDLIYTQREGETAIKVFQNFISDEAQIGQTLVNPATRERGVLSFAVSPATYLIALLPPARGGIEGGAGTMGNGIPYEFSVSISPVTEPDLVELEPNATPSTATPIPLNRSITGTSWDGSKDIDYYRVEVTEPGILWLGLTRPNGVGSTKLMLRDGSGGEIGSTQISSNSLQTGHLQVGAIHESPLQRGSYTVQISPENERSGSAYQLVAFFARSAKHELVGSPGVARPLRLGEKLRVTVDAAPDLRAEFEIIDARTQAVIVPSSRFVVTTLVVPPYNGEYTVAAGDNFEGATVIVRLTNANGVMAALSVESPITVDTVPPVIQSVSHNATNPDLSARPLRLGDELTVTLIGEAGGKAFFIIETSEVSKTSEVFILGVSVSLIESKEAQGRYVGTYKIREADNATIAQVKVTLIDAAGNATSQTISPPLSIDTIPPAITSVRHNATKILSDSAELIVTLVGEAGGRASFDIVGVIDGSTGEPPVPLVIEGVRLFDDGGHNDGAANDGVYVGTYRVRPGDHALNATVVGHLADAVGNASTLSASETVTIDTLPPQIEAIEHDATAPLALGEVLTVKLVGEANADIRFEIINADTGVVLLPPSKFQVVTQRVEGKVLVQYIATYTVREGDDITSGKVRATLTKRNGKSATRTALLPITIDTVPPPPTQGVTAVDRPDDEGGFIHLSWRSSDAADFDHYNIYQQDTPISQPVVTTLVAPGTTKVVTTRYEIKVDRNGVDFYFAVTAVDKAGNESLLARGADGSIAMGRAIDNLPPPPVLGVTAIDSPNDFGGRVTLAWLSPNPALDFAQYRIYLSPLPITTTTGLRPIVTIPDRNLINVDVPTPSDDFDYYFAVTAVDISGNESIFGTGSAIGPVQSHNNIGIRIETPVQIVSGPIGLVRQKSVTFHWSTFNLQSLPRPLPYEGTGGEGSPRYAFRLDDAPFQFTTSNQMTFYNLREGVHTFSVKLAEGDGGTATRTFSVLPTFTTEVEPNDVPSFANPLTASAIVRGANAADSDEDWYLLNLQTSIFNPQSSILNQIDLHIERPAGIGQTIVSVFDVDSPQDSAVISEVRANAATRQRAQLSLGVNGQTNGLLVRVRSEGENPGAGYELSLAIMQRDNRSVLEVERNDTPNFATVLPNPLTPFPTREGVGGEVGDGFEIVGRADRSHDMDWYRLDVTPPPLARGGTEGGAGASPSLVSITLSTASPLTTKLKAYAGTRISPDNQIGEIELTPSKPGQNYFTIAVTAGTYLLSVENGDIATLQSALTYRIFVQFHDIPTNRVWEIEPNGSRANAMPIVIDSQIYGTSWHPNDDLDWFRLPIQQRGILGVGLHRPNGIGVTEMRLTDAGGNELAATTTEPITNSAFISLDVLPGSYYIQLNPESEDTTNAYVLTPVLIRNASHNAVDKILGRDSELIVTLDWVPGRTATFHIKSNSETQKGEASRPTPEIRVPMIAQGNGTYVGKYKVPPDVQIVKGEVIIELGGIAQVDNVPDTVQIRLKGLVTIDTLPPQITQVRHDAVKPNGEVRPLGLGKTIHIRLVSEPGGFGKFKIERSLDSPPSIPPRAGGSGQGEGFQVNGDLFDDGTHEDDAANDGIYGGSYIIRLGDNVTDAKLTGILEDLAGNVAELESVKTVMFDTQPPPITALTFTVTRPEVGLVQRTNLLAGDLLTVTLVGEIGSEAEFDLGTLLSSVRLFDDGTHGDQRSNDGVYTNTYVVRASDTLSNGVITGRLRDRAGNENENTSPILINIDTTPPSIQTIEHNAINRPLIAGARLIVLLRGDPSGTATFDIGSFQTGLIMVDDGSGVDEKAGDGVYTGLYEIKPGDNAHDAVISGRLVDESGNQTIARAAVRVTIDATPPPAITGVTAADGPNDQGNVLIVTWNAPPLSPPVEGGGREGSDFARYHIYREASPIRSTFGLIPLSLNLVVHEQTIAQITVPRNNFDYYIAVTAVDSAGNESILANDSTFGPVRALDNIPPPPILGVKAENKTNDNGKTIIVRWAPLQIDNRPSQTTDNRQFNDFARYQIYVDTQPIASVEHLTTPQRAQGTAATLADQNTIEAEVPVPADKTDFYVAVTAVDENGNESTLDLGPDGSTFGPVQSRDETPPDPVLNVVAIDTPGDQGKSLTVAWTAQIGVGVSHYLLYLSASPIRSAEDLKDIHSTSEPLARLTGEPPALQPMRADGERTDLSTLPTSVDNFNFYIAVAAVDFGDNVSVLQPDGGSVAGPVQSVSNTIRLTTPTTISAGFDPRTKITVPPRAAQSGQTIDIFIPSDETLLAQIDEANHFVAEAHIDEGIDAEFQGTVREFVLTSRTLSAPDEKFSIPAELTLSYPVQTQTPISPEIEADLRIFRLNTKGRVALWELVPGVQRVNREKTVTVPVDSLTTSIFRVARLKLPNNLKNVVVYPNPFIPGQSGSQRVIFLNLTENATIEIYTLNGERVWSKTVETSAGTATWDGRNGSGMEVASGLYIYLIRSDVDKAVGRIMVMR